MKFHFDLRSYVRLLLVESVSTSFKTNRARGEVVEVDDDKDIGGNVGKNDDEVILEKDLLR